MTAAGDRARIAAAFRPGRQVATPDTPRDIIARALCAEVLLDYSALDSTQQASALSTADAALAALATSSHTVVKLPEPDGTDGLGDPSWDQPDLGVSAGASPDHTGLHTPDIWIFGDRYTPADAETLAAQILAAARHATEMADAANHATQETTDG